LKITDKQYGRLS